MNCRASSTPPADEGFMNMSTPYVSIVFEGASDQEMAKKIVSHSGLRIQQALSKSGSSNVDKLAPKLAKTGPWNPWVVFRDSDTACPVELYRKLMSSAPPNPAFLLRIVHPMSEGWLMADAQSFSQYFKVPANKIPADTETLTHAKRHLLSLCVKSRSINIRNDVVRSDGTTGPLYAPRINDFAEKYWDVRTAAQNSPSLHRALARLEELRSFLLTR